MYAFILHASSIQVLFWLIYYIMVSSFLCTTFSSPSCSSFFKVALFPNMYYRISAGNDVLQWLCSIDVRACSTTQQGGDIVFRHKYLYTLLYKNVHKKFSEGKNEIPSFRNVCRTRTFYGTISYSERKYSLPQIEEKSEAINNMASTPSASFFTNSFVDWVRYTLPTFIRLRRTGWLLSKITKQIRITQNYAKMRLRSEKFKSIFSSIISQTLWKNSNV